MAAPKEPRDFFGNLVEVGDRIGLRDPHARSRTLIKAYVQDITAGGLVHWTSDEAGLKWAYDTHACNVFVDLIDKQRRA